jgi:hypothetical protein
MRSGMAQIRTSNAKPAVRKKERRSGGELEFGCLEVGAERSGECPNEAIDKGGDIVVRSKFERSALIVDEPWT